MIRSDWLKKKFKIQIKPIKNPNQTTNEHSYTLNCIRYYPMARRTWEQLGFARNHCFFMLDRREWVLESSTFELAHFFLSGAWWIWCSRNAHALVGENWTILDVVRRITHMANELRSIYGYENHTVGHRQPLVRWEHPPHRFCKMNVDGSLYGSLGKAGFGGVVRMNNGEWIIGFSGFLGQTTTLHTKLGALQT